MSKALLFLAVFISSVHSAANVDADLDFVPVDVKSGYYQGRSGHIILKPTNTPPQTKDLLAIFMDKSGKYFDRASAKASDMDIYNVADVIARGVGIQPMNADYVPDFVKSSVFARPQANLLIELESIGADLLQKHNTKNLQNFKDDQIAVKVNSEAYPQNSLSVATSMATGKSPAVHGIVGKVWSKKSGELVQAFMGEDSSAAVASFVDILGQSTKGKSLMVSVSADRQQSMVNSPSALLETASEWNAHTFFLDQDSSFKSGNAVADKNLGYSYENLRKDLKDSEKSFLSSLAGGVETKMVGDDMISVTYPANWGEGTQSAQYDLTIPEEGALFAELQFAHALPERLTKYGSTNNLINDNVPDSFVLTLSALTKLIEKYGRESTESVGALHLIDTALPGIVNKINAMYNDDMTTELILMGSHASSLETTDTREILAQVHRLLPDQGRVTEFFPSVYVPEDVELGRICEGMSRELERSGFSVYCPGQIQTAFPQVFANVKVSVKVGDGPTDDEIARYQIVLWLSISLVLATLSAVYVLGWMDFKKDTLLYCSFNPNWEDRKRR